MKKKLLLFTMALLACGIMSVPQAKADVVSGDQDFILTIPSAASWDLNPTAPNFGVIASTMFTWTGGGAPVDIPEITFGAIATPVSFLITNDTSTVDDLDVTIDISTNGADTTAATFPTDVDTIRITSAVASVDVDITKIGGAGPAEIGGTPFEWVDTGSIATDAGTTPMTSMGSNQYPVDIELDVDQATLTEADGPCEIGFTLTFTLATIAP